MIPVAMQQEPATFSALVRTPGRAFLRRIPRPSRDQWKGAEFWKSALPDLRSAYKNVCAYCCFWVPMDSSVDHFFPKSAYPAQAYEWRNFRLAHQKINAYKGDSTGVLDPFSIQPGWFTIDFANCHVKPNPATSAAIQSSVTQTIKALRLNSDDSFVQARFLILRNYAKGKLDMSFLEDCYPFIAAELKRQGVQELIKGTIP